MSIIDYFLIHTLNEETMLKSIIITICIIAGLFAKDPNDVIKAEKKRVNIQASKKKDLKVMYLSKVKASKFLNKNSTSLEKKRLNAELIEKVKAADIGVNRARDLIHLAVSEKQLFPHSVKRSGTNDLQRIARYPQEQQGDLHDSHDLHA